MIEKMKVRFGGASTFSIAMLSMAAGFGLACIPLEILVTLGMVAMAILGAAAGVASLSIIDEGFDALVDVGADLVEVAESLIVHIIDCIDRTQIAGFDALAFLVARIFWHVQDLAEAGAAIFKTQLQIFQALVWQIKSMTSDLMFGVRYVSTAMLA